MLGTGRFVFVEHVKGDHWTGKRWTSTSSPGSPNLDGFRAEFMAGTAAVKAMESGRILAQFRSFTPTDRDEMIKAAGDHLEVREGPWITYLALVFNATRPPFDDARVRRALSLAIDRWHGAETLADNTFLEICRRSDAAGHRDQHAQAELVTLPGFTRHRRLARGSAAASGRSGSTEPGSHTDQPQRRSGPLWRGLGEFVVAAWREIGVQATQELLSTKDWQTALETGRFIAATDLAADYFDDPTIQLARYVSRDLSPINHSGSTDRFLDALYIGQALSTDPLQRAKIVRAFERHALNDAYTVPLLWWNRIVVTGEKFKGWNMSPSSLHWPRPGRRVARGMTDGPILEPKTTSRAIGSRSTNGCDRRGNPFSCNPFHTISLAAADPRDRLHGDDSQFAIWLDPIRQSD